MASRSLTAASTAGSAARTGSPEGSRWASHALSAIAETSVDWVNPVPPPSAGETRSPFTRQRRSVPSSGAEAGSSRAGSARLGSHPVRTARVASPTSHSGTAARRPTLAFHTRAAAATSGPSVHSSAGRSGSSAPTTSRRTSASIWRSSSLATAASAAFTPRAARRSAGRKPRS
ncbi:hypothetical protein [Streptosporangium vulgare]|uniref:hypothetical protein n=1 Tax=Streptosporangium vulgare TaxID=46190 RepID=UPI0031DC168C